MKLAPSEERKEKKEKENLRVLPHPKSIGLPS